MNGLVLEGGGMRGLFTAGVLDTMMDENLVFDGMIGVSAGALFGCNYKSRQKGRALRYNINLRNDPRYMGLRTLLKTGNIVGPEFAYHVVPFEIDKFDSETFRSNPMEFWMVCTDIVNGKPVYHKMEEFNHHELEWMRASASMPLVSTPVEIDGYTMLDGGMINSIPLEAFQNMGYDRNIVILTQPLGYKKKQMKIIWMFKHFCKKYPKIGEIMERRFEMYNAQLDYIEQESRKGNTLLIYPEEALRIGRTEADEKKMRRAYSLGCKKADELMLQIKDFLIHG